jgi:Spy/CpxP family protein refolding chaperone
MEKRKITKLLLLILATSILFAGVVTISYAHRGGGYGRGFSMRGPGGMGGLGVLRFSTDPKLRLTEAQTAKIDKIRLSHITRMWKIRNEIFRLYNNNASSEKIETLRNQMFKLRDSTWNEILKVLTLKQRQEINGNQNYGRYQSRRGNGYEDCPGYSYGRGYGHGRGYGRERGGMHGRGYGRGYGMHGGGW